MFMFMGCQLFPLPDQSLPRVVVVAALLSAQFKYDPLVPKLPVNFFGFITPPVWYAKLSQLGARPSTNCISAISIEHPYQDPRSSASAPMTCGRVELTAPLPAIEPSETRVESTTHPI